MHKIVLDLNLYCKNHKLTNVLVFSFQVFYS